MTLVNVFTVDPERQEELAALLIRATDDTMRHIPGFISATIHRSADGTKVINYAQWRSRADFTALQQNSRARPHLEAAAQLATAEPIVCEVVYSVSHDG
jgi:heme-degrading monooxygenase HmoA